MNKIRSKKLIVFIILAFALVIVGYIYSAYFAESEEDKQVVSVVSSSKSASTIDSDDDSLADWQEELWGTNAHKFDTDGDGTSDGREVKEGRDPLVPGPDDRYSKPLVATNLASGATYEYDKDTNVGNNLTEQVSINLATNYLNAKSLGTYSPAMGEQIADQITTTVTNAGLYNDILLSDLNIGPMTTSASTIVDYGTKIDSAIKLGFKPNQELGETEIIQASLSIGDYAKLRELKPYIDGYKASTQRLLAISVPGQFAQIHLDFTRAFDTLAKSLQGISKATVSDPLIILQELNRYELAIDEIRLKYKEGTDLANELMFQ